MLFSYGNGIDLQIQTLDFVLNGFEADKLIITLLNKDDVLPKILKASDEDYCVKKST